MTLLGHILMAMALAAGVVALPARACPAAEDEACAQESEAAATAPQLPASAPKLASFDEYRAELDRAAEALPRLKDHPEEARALHRSLPDKLSVSSGAPSFAIDLTPIKRALGEIVIAKPERRAALLGSLDAAIRDMRAGVQEFAAPADTRAAHAQLAEILSRREFREVRGPTLLEIWRDRVATWIMRQLDRIFGKVHVGESGNRILLWILVAITACVLAVWLWRIGRRRQVEVVRVPIPFAPSGRSWRAWLADARAAADEGRWRDAVHFAYWAAISSLEEGGAWTPDRARTPREYLRLLSQASAYRPALGELTRKFEVVWYGDQPAAAGDYESVLRSLEALGCR